jgi:hypothetical protein
MLCMLRYKLLHGVPLPPDRLLLVPDQLISGRAGRRA